MVRDYHVHAQVLQQPERFGEFVAAAVANGVEEICITDHMPLRGNSAKDRIPAGRVAEYARRVRELAAQYSGILSIKCGIEIDYHPSVCDQIEAVLAAASFDFVLGSSHLHVFDEIRTSHTRSAFATAMLDNVAMAAASGYFDAIPHIDMYRWIFTIPDRYPLPDDGMPPSGEAVERALAAIKANGLRREINPHFALHGRNMDRLYPALPILSAALDMGIPFCYGSDAHQPQDVGSMLDEIRGHGRYGRALATWEDGI